MFEPDSLDILLILRGAAEDFPPTIHQANILAESGLKVGIVDYKFRRFEKTEVVLNALIKRYSFQGWDSLYDLPQTLWKRFFVFARFRTMVSKILRISNPKVVIAYDSPAFFMLGPAKRWPRERMTIVHFHELPEMRADLSFGGRRDLRFALRNSRYADYVVFPEPNRATLFAMQAGLSNKPEIVFNCPRRIEQLPSNQLSFALSERGLFGKRVVLYQGIVGHQRGLMNVIRSMVLWPPDVILVLIGPAKADVLLDFEQIVSKLGVSEKVVFLPSVSSSKIMNFTVGADVGLSLYEVIGDNERFAASNKLMEYMTVGVPQITNRGSGFDELVHEAGIGLGVNPNSPDEIGQAVRKLLSDDELRVRMGQAARKAHLTKFNYEDQFAPVLQKILEWSKHN